MTRSLLAIVIGYLVFAGPSFAFFRVGGIDPHARPSGGLLVLTIVYGLVFALLAGYLTVRLAGRAVLWPLLAVAAIVALMAALSLVFAHDVYWTQLSALVLMAPAVVLGGALRLRSQR